MKLFCNSFEVISNVADCYETVNVIVTDLNVEFFFTLENEVSKFKGVDPEITDELRIGCNISFIYGKLFYKKCF